MLTIHACRVSPCSSRRKPIFSSISSCFRTAANRSSICEAAISTFVLLAGTARDNPRCNILEPRRRNVPRLRMVLLEPRASGMSKNVCLLLGSWNRKVYLNAATHDKTKHASLASTRWIFYGGVHQCTRCLRSTRVER